jgi:hypothetical protein
MTFIAWVRILMSIHEAGSSPNKPLQADKGKLSRPLLEQRPRQPAFAAERHR